MSFGYEVILRPNDVKFSEKKIPTKFDNGVTLKDLVDKINNGETKTKDVPAIQVIWFCDKWKWYTLNNRRLWVFQQLENCGKLNYVSMCRVELLDLEYEYPKELYDSVELYEPDWDIISSNNNLETGPERESLKSMPNLTQLELNERVTAIDLNQNKEDFITNNNKVVITTGSNKNNSCAITEERKGNGAGIIADERHHDEDLPEVCIVKCIKQEVILDNEETSEVDNRSSRRKKAMPVFQTKKSYTKTMSRYSTSTASSLTRRQRVLHSSGLFGYGYYHIYKTEYLDKIQNGRNRVMKHYKPYNVVSSRTRSPWPSRCSSHSDLMIDANAYSSWESSSQSNFQVSEYRHPNTHTSVELWRKDSLKKRGRSTSSRTNDLSSNERGHSSSYKLSYDERVDSASRRSYFRQSSPTPNGYGRMSPDLSTRCRARSRIHLHSDNVDYHNSDEQDWDGHSSSCSAYSSGRYATSESSVCDDRRVVKYNNNVTSGVKLSVLYELWQNRRAKYLEHNFSTGKVTKAIDNSYLCGICFKSFRHIVDLQQHSEALMHYACITCGKFFSSYASLGQHSQVMGHKKD